MGPRKSEWVREHNGFRLSKTSTLQGLSQIRLLWLIQERFPGILYLHGVGLSWIFAAKANANIQVVMAWFDKLFER